MSNESLERTEKEEIVYLDPMDIEVDKYNIRHDSPIDEDVIGKIKDDLRSGKGIEYHITVRFKDGKYYCYIGRNRLLATKKYVKETGKKVMIPAKVKNVDNWMALKMSLDENLKRKQLLPSEVSHALTELYEQWRRRKKYIINMNQGGVGPRDQLKENMKENSTKYIKDTNQEEYHPQDPRNPFTISKFVEESNVPLKRKEVKRLLAIDSLPLEIKRGLDEKYIDMHTAYELTKFSRDEQLNLYHSFRSFRKIPRDVREEALKEYMDNRDQPFDIILVDEYRNYISSKYPIFGRLSDGQIADMAQNVDSDKLGKLAENLEYMINEGLKVNDISLKHIERLVFRSKEELERYSRFKSMLKTKAEKLGMRFYDEDLAWLYLENGEIGLLRKEGELNVWMKKLEISNPEDFRRKLRERSATARYEVNKIEIFLSTHPAEFADELRRILEKRDWIILRKAVDDVYDYLLKSPGYIPREKDERRKIRKGILYRLYRREYSVGETLIRNGFANKNLGDVEKGVKIIIGILERIEGMLDYKTQNLLLMLLKGLPIDTEIHDMNADEYNRFSRYISLMQKIDSFLELYVYIREYISSMDEYMRNARADEVMKLIGIYKGFMRTVQALNGEIQYSGMTDYISRSMNMDICRNIVRFIDLRNEVADSLMEIDDDINSIKNEMMAEQLRMKYVEHKKDFKEYTRQYNIRGLELLKNRVDKFIEEYTRELSNRLNKTTTVKIKKCCEYEPVLLTRMVDENLKCEVLDKADYTDDIEGEVEYMGEIYDVVFEKTTHLKLKSIKKKVSRIDD